MTEIGERSCLNRRLGHARGDEAGAQLLAALGIIEAASGGRVGSARIKLSRLAGRLGGGRLVLTLELLYVGDGEDLGGVKAYAIADSLADPCGGAVEIVGVAGSRAGSRQGLACCHISATSCGAADFHHPGSNTGCS